MSMYEIAVQIEVARAKACQHHGEGDERPLFLDRPFRISYNSGPMPHLE